MPTQTTPLRVAKIVTALRETIRLMGEIDEVIDNFNRDFFVLFYD